MPQTVGWGAVRLLRGSPQEQGQWDTRAEGHCRGCSLCPKEMQETKPAPVAAPCGSWLPGRAESSPNSPGEDRPQDKTKANTRRTLGGTSGLG